MKLTKKIFIFQDNGDANDYGKFSFIKKKSAREFPPCANLQKYFSYFMISFISEMIFSANWFAVSSFLLSE